MNDVRFGLRILARNPGSSVMIIGLLALGTGASATIFSLFDAVLLRRLPVPHPEQLVRLVQHFSKTLGSRSEFPYVYYKALRERSKTLETVFADTDWYARFRMTDPEPAQAINVYGVTPEFFEALGVKPLIGRLVLPDDATRNFGTPPAVLSYDFWRKRFGSDTRSILGKTFAIKGHRFSVVGVTPRGFHGLSADHGPDVRIPLQAFSPLVTDFSLDHAEYQLAGRLKPGITVAEAQAECLTIWRSMMKDYYEKIEKRPPEAVSALVKRGVEVQSLERGTSILRDNFGDVFKLLMASVSLLLVIVALNVAGLLLAGAAARQREMALRLAVGGTPLRLARQLLTEGMLLSVFGTLGGVIVALIVMPMAVRALPPIRDLSTEIVPISLDPGLNWRVFWFLIASAVITMLIFTASPVVMTLRISIDRVLRSVRSSSSFRGRQVLIAAQIALCTFLLATAGLFVRSFEKLRSTPSGFDIDSIATFRCDFGEFKHAPPLIDALLERVREIPGVVSAATSVSGVMREHGFFATMVPAGQRITRADFMDSNANGVSRDYFATMGMRLLAGRAFIPSDIPGPKQTTHRKAIVNEAFVRRLFAGSTGIGKTFGTGMEGGVASAQNEIIGVVSDAKYRSLRDPIRPMCYTPETDFDPDFMLNVRTSVPPEKIIQPVRRALASAAPGLALLETGTLTQTVDETTAPERMTAAVASLFGAMATLLAAIGTYGLLAYAVTQRRREIGIRIALGAQPAQVAKLIAGQTFAIAAAGIMTGLATAFLAGPATRTLLYGISPQDPTALAASAIIVGLIAVAAAIGPASRAVQVQPGETLRIEG